MANGTLTNITPPRVPLLDPKTGLISREWYRFLLNLFVLTGGGQNTTTLTDLQLGPASPTVDEINAIVLNATDNLRSSQDGLLDQIAELQKQIEGLQMTPPPRQFERSRYGSFYDTTTQTATTINTAKAVTFNNTDLTNGVYLGTPTSRVYVDTPGIYNFDTSFQLDKTAGGVGLFYLWFRLNGVDVSDSASQIRVQGNNAEVFSSLNYFFDLNAGDYVEIMYSVDDLTVEILAEAAAAPHPGIPSIILTVSNNIGGIQ
jgi:hypothetical protein